MNSNMPRFHPERRPLHKREYDPDEWDDEGPNRGQMEKRGVLEPKEKPKTEVKDE